jgi:dTMP kinase
MDSFIVFEGPDGAGKSTQAKLLKENLESRGREVLLVREPGGSALGEKIREILLQENCPLTPLTEVFLFNAARSQLIAEVIRPALEKGQVVICDRYYPSTLVYQAFAGGLDLEKVSRLCDMALEDTRPDRILVLDLPLESSLKRLSGRKDRFESRGEVYLEKVRRGFLTLAAERAWPVFDASRSVALLHGDILSHLGLT